MVVVASELDVVAEATGRLIAVQTTAVIAVVGRERGPTVGEKAKTPFERLPRQRTGFRKLWENAA